MVKKDLMICDAVTRDKNNPESPLYRIIEFKEDGMLLLRRLDYCCEDLELHEDQVHLVIPYPRSI